MGSQVLRTRNRTPVFTGEDETEEGIPEQYFCKEIRNFKNLSRSFHELYAEAEGAHGPRSFGQDQKNMLEMVVMDACHYPNRYEGKQEWSKDKKAECSAIVDEILSISKMMGKTGEVKLEVVFLTMYQYSSKKTSVVPLFKIYGNCGNSTFITKDRRKYKSLHYFVDNNNFPHSLVCAAREGRTKTYEIDRSINKYPLVFFTVNYSRQVDRRLEYERIRSTILKNTIILDLPFLLVQGFFELIHVEVKYFASNVNYNEIVTDSMKYKFYKFVDNYKHLIPWCGTLVNQAIVMGFTYSFKLGFLKNEELEKALVLNGNLLIRHGVNFLISTISPSSPLDVTVFPDVSRNSFSGFSLGKECSFEELKSQFKKSKMYSGTVSACSDIIKKLCVLGEKVIDMFAPFLIKNGPIGTVVLVSLKVMLRIAPFFIRMLNNKSKKTRNYVEPRVGDKVLMPDDGDYSLKHFLETTRTKNDISALLSDEEEVKNDIEREIRECAADDSQFICLDDRRNAYISLAPTFAVIEKILENSNKNARVLASEDNSFYQISSEEALFKIYPFKNDNSNLEIQYVYVEERLPRSGQNIFK